MWAIIVAHVCNNWGIYMIMTSMPGYMNDVLKFDMKQVSALKTRRVAWVRCQGGTNSPPWKFIDPLTYIAEFLKLKTIFVLLIGI